MADTMSLDGTVTTAPTIPTTPAGEAKRVRLSHERRHQLVMSFDVEMTGDYVGHDDMLAFGAAAGYVDPETNQVRIVYRALVVRQLKPMDWSWYRVWRQRGYEVRCYEEFWSKHMDTLKWYDDVCQRDDLVSVETRIMHPGWSAESVEAASSSDAIMVRYKRGRLAKDGTSSPATKLLVVETEQDMAFCIDRVLRQMEKRSAGFKCVQVNDTIDFDAIHVNYLLGKYEYPSTLYTRIRTDETTQVRVNKRYMGDRYEIDSVILGLTRANLLASGFDYDRNVQAYKRWLEHKLTVHNDHLAHHDAEHKVTMFLLAQHELATALRENRLWVECDDSTPGKVVWRAVDATSVPIGSQQH